MSLQAVSPSLFFSKNDPNDIRLGDIVKPAGLGQITDSSVCFLGYPDDEGISLNGGRPGAAQAPTEIRRFLYKMTPSSEAGSFLDLGDLKNSGSLGERHQTARTLMLELHKKKARTVSFGGGHDYGFPDTAGFAEAFLGGAEKPVVLNFDAHLDVRPSEKNFNSGTPFYRLLNEFEGRLEFAEIGIQPQCNSIHHREWAKKKGAHLFDLSTLEKNGGLKWLLSQAPFSQLKKTTPVFVSFDIDCLTSSEAPGCSQSWVTGLYTRDVLNFMKELAQRCNLRGIGLYEVSPPLDADSRTSKTAALIAYHFLFQGGL